VNFLIQDLKIITFCHIDVGINHLQTNSKSFIEGSITLQLCCLTSEVDNIYHDYVVALVILQKTPYYDINWREQLHVVLLYA